MARFSIIVFGVFLILGIVNGDVEHGNTSRRVLFPLNEPVPENKEFPYNTLPLVKSSETIECYTCSDCPKVTNTTNTAKKICLPSTDASRNKCVTYVEKYTYLDRPWYIRGCVSERGTCDEIKKAHDGADLVTVVQCNECSGDKCNFSSSQPIIAFFNLIVIPIALKCTLS